jgi:transcription antitermination factor NusG
MRSSSAIKDSDWYILRTSNGRTVRLAASLSARNIEAWTPVRVVKRPAPGQRRRLVMGQRRKMIEMETPILPGFVFVRARHLDELAHIASLPFSEHPEFSVFQRGGRAPVVSERSIDGLREAEAAAAADIAARRAADSADEVRRIRSEQMRRERDRRKAMRREWKSFEPGAEVLVENPAFDGLTGRIVSSNGATAMVDFGGALVMKVEAWQVIPAALSGGLNRSGIAA